MYYKLYFAASFCLLALCCESQNFSESSGFSFAMGEAGTASIDAFSTSNNTASMAFLEHAMAGVTAKNHFLVEDLNQYAGNVGLPVSFGVLGFAINYYGDETFNETQVGLAYARKLTDKASIGLKANYFTTQAAFADNESLLYPELGFFYRLTEHVDVGSRVSNPFSQTLNSPFEEQLNPLLTIGLNYHPNDAVVLAIQADERVNDGFAAKLGITYQAIQKLNIMAGFRTRPATITAGIKLSLAKFDVAAGGGYHNELGTSPFTALSYGFKK